MFRNSFNAHDHPIVMLGWIYARMKRQCNEHKDARVLQFGWIFSLEEQGTKPDARQNGATSNSGQFTCFTFR